MNAIAKFNLGKVSENVRDVLERTFNKDLRDAHTENARIRVKRNMLVLEMYKYKLESTKKFDASRLADEEMARREKEEEIQNLKEARLQASENRQLQHQRRRFRDFQLELEERRLRGLEGEELDLALRRSPFRIFDGLATVPGSPFLIEPDEDSRQVVNLRSFVSPSDTDDAGN